MFEQLDFVYEPSRGVAADVEYYRGALGAEFVFAVERFGTRVAMVRLTSDAPGLLLAEHLEGAARPAALDSGLRRTTQDLGPVVSPSGHRRTAGAAGERRSSPGKMRRRPHLRCRWARSCSLALAAPAYSQQRLECKRGTDDEDRGGEVDESEVTDRGQAPRVVRRQCDGESQDRCRYCC
jgi:hypothetical protein